MPISKLPLKQIQASAAEYQHLGEQLIGMSQPFYQEVVAVAGQQLVTVNKPFTTGTKQLKVFVNGILQQEGASGGYVELNSTTVMFNEPLAEGDLVVFRVEGAGAGFVPLNSSGGSSLTPAEVKALYESNPDTNAFTDAEQAKLASVEWGANNYVHPSTHPAAMIVEDSQHRFVTDEEKTRWNSGGVGYTPLNKAGDTVEGNLGVQGSITVSGDILPTTNSVQNIGSPTARFKGIYVDEAHLSVSTLYIGSTPILGTEEAKINFQADPNQTIDIKTTGIGEARMSSEKLVDISTPATATADINIHTDSASSKLTLGSASEVDITAPVTKVNGDLNVSGATTMGGLVVTGNATFQGTVFTINSQAVTTAETIITLNSGEAGAGVTAGTSGIQVDRGTLPDAQLVFDEADDMFKVGVEGSLEVVATRPWVEQGFTPKNHIGANGTVHAVATQSMAGFMSAADKAKLDGIEVGANKYIHPTTKQCSYQYVHPTDDGYLHVPATGTTNAGKVLKAGGAPGAISWASVDWGEITNRPGLATSQVSGLMAAVDKAKLDTIASGAEPNQNAFSAIRIGTQLIQAANKTDVFELVAGQGVQITVDTLSKKITVSAVGTAPSARKYRVAVQGAVDGVNTVFQIPEGIVPNTEEVFVNGLLMDQGVDNDYVISGSTITFNVAPPVGAKILVSYDPA